MIPPEWLDQAALRIAPHIRRTLLANDAKRNLYLKWENQQVTGSFKARGAINKVLTLAPWELRAGLVTASAGNHGQGLALAGKMADSPVLIFASDHAVPAKVEAMRSLGAEVRFVEGGYELAESTAISHAAEAGKTFISAYNDGQIVAGQGTVALEILEDLGDLPGATWLVPVGGGGLLAGVGAALERCRHRPRLVGIQAEASAFMHALYHTGSQAGIADLPTLADGLAGAVEADALTLPMVKRFADDLLLVSEQEIGGAVAFAWHVYRQVVEGSGAVGLAAFLAGKVESPAVVILSGGNIQPEIHEQLCHHYPLA